jgi:ABC-type glycerol-3-phosphate transport system substrate-binding protein
MTRAMKRVTVLLTVSFLAAAGCGDDDDESSSAGTGTTQEETATAADSQAAQDLETYLKKQKVAKNVSYVEAVDGELKIWTLLNAAAATDDKPARQVCRAAIESGIPAAEGAHLLDAGAEEFFRCGGKS